jgi:tetratricopeptide (TPR) repeat protein
MKRYQLMISSLVAALTYSLAIHAADRYQLDMPADVVSKTSQARQLRLENHFAESEDLLEPIVRRYPNYFLAHYDLGLAYEEQKKESAAIEELERAKQLNIELMLREPTIYNSLGWAYLQDKQYTKALAEFELARSPEVFALLDSESQQKVLNNEGLTQAYLGQPSKAADLFMSASKVVSQNTSDKSRDQGVAALGASAAILDQLRAALKSGSSADLDTAYRTLETAIRFNIPFEVRNAVRTQNDLQTLFDNIRSPSLPSEFDSRLIGVLSSCLPEPDLYVGGTKGTIPAKHLSNALRLMSKSGSVNDEVVGLLNATIIGNSRDFMLFGHKGLYFRTSHFRTRGPQNASIPYLRLTTWLVMKKALSEVAIGPEDTFSVAGSSMSAEKLAKVLNGIRAIVLLNHVAAKSGPDVAAGRH